jgi:ribosomal protein L12E/L44/L45/RPP1/RPP2
MGSAKGGVAATTSSSGVEDASDAGSDVGHEGHVGREEDEDEEEDDEEEEEEEVVPVVSSLGLTPTSAQHST